MTQPMLDEAIEQQPGKANLLLIDDSSFVRKLFSVVFTDLGYAVDTATNGNEGIVRVRGGTYDVVVVDGQLGDMNGTEICQKIAQLPAERRPITIFYSGTMRPSQARQEALKGGADAYLVKDACNEGLVLKIRELLAERESRVSAERTANEVVC